MRSRIFNFALMAVSLLVVAAAAGCGSSPTPTPEGPSGARRTSAAANASQATPDGLDDSPDPVVPTTDPNEPTPDPLNDSPGSPVEEGTLNPPARPEELALPGTSWYLAQEDKIYRFCEDNRWEVVQGGDSVENSGTWTMTGENLTLQETANNTTKTYALTWNAEDETLRLQDTAGTLTLEFDGETDCS